MIEWELVTTWNFKQIFKNDFLGNFQDVLTVVLNHSVIKGEPVSRIKRKTNWQTNANEHKETLSRIQLRY